MKNSSQGQVSLPKLSATNSQSVQKINMQQAQANQQAANDKFGHPPPTAGVTSGRFGSSTANTYEITSNMGGFPVDPSRMNQYAASSTAKGAPSDENSFMPGSALAGQLPSAFSGADTRPTLDKQFGFAAKGKLTN